MTGSLLSVCMGSSGDGKTDFTKRKLAHISHDTEFMTDYVFSLVLIKLYMLVGVCW